MRHYTIFLHDIKDRDSLHTRLLGALMLPDYYGRNLDALRDCLTDVKEESEIVIKGFDDMSSSIPDYSRVFKDVLHDICKENPRLSVIYK